VGTFYVGCWGASEVICLWVMGLFDGPITQKEKAKNDETNSFGNKSFMQSIRRMGHTYKGGIFLFFFPQSQVVPQVIP
jgi:hypothetical protein